MITRLLAALAIAAPTMAAADLSVRFIEGAPTDRFVITNIAECATGPFELTLDLAPSRGALIFDVTASGAGVEVFQPVVLVNGSDAIDRITAAADGDQTLTLSIADLGPSEVIAFTADLDDQLTDSDLGQIRVSDAEIMGAVIRADLPGGATEARFDDRARATVAITPCTS